MKLISKIHLTNWHYITKKTLELNEGVNYFTGKTGAGKSTAIDAIQLIILGDTKGKYFNKAANDESKRTLIEYLKGMVKDNETEGKKYLRGDFDFSTHVVIEVNDTKYNKQFCLGVVFDIRKNSDDYEHQFFFFDAPLPEEAFWKSGIPLDITNLKEQFKGKINYYTTEEYKEKFLHQHMGKLKKDFFDTFKKSVSFKPPKSIREFINDFVCEDVNIDIDLMKENIRLYKHLEKEMERTKEQISMLKDIKVVFESWLKFSKEKKLHEFIIKKSDVEAFDNDISKMISGIKDAKDFIEINQKEVDRLEQEILQIQERKLILQEEIDDSEENKLRKKLKEIKEKVEDFKKIERHYIARAIEFNKWIGCFEDWEEISGDTLCNIEFLKCEVNKFKEYKLDEIEFLNLNMTLKDLLDKVNIEYHENRTKLTSCETEIQRLHNENKIMLSEGKKKYPNSVVILRNKIAEALSEKHNKSIEVDILADLIEIKDKTWKNAIEGYMNTQKLYLIVDPSYYEDALTIYNSLDKDKYYGVGIVDVQKISEKGNVEVFKNSLAEEIETNNPYAKTFVNYLLGSVIKCEDISRIRSHHTAITRDCFLYKGFIARRINPETYKVNVFIGKDSVQLRIQKNDETITGLQSELKNYENRKSTLLKYTGLKVFTNYDISEIIENQQKILKINALDKQIEDYTNKLASIDLLYVLKLQEELIEIERRYTVCNGTKVKLKGNIIEKSVHIQFYSDEVPKKEGELRIKNGLLNSQFGIDWIQEIGNTYFQNILNSDKNLMGIKKKYENLLNVEVEPNESRTFDILVKRREIFLERNMKLWDKQAKTNERFDSYLKELEETEFPKYEDKIVHQKNRAYQEFKEDLLYKLKDGITKTEEQIKFLNKAIEEIWFGSKQYKFKVKGSKKYHEFYQMLNDELLMMPNSMFSVNFEAKYSHQIKELFDMLADSGEQDLSSNEMERLKDNINKYTDYRTYLDFDMTEDFEGETSDLSRTMLKTSGGETQSPFYIAVLASFVQAYRMNKKDKDETMRLIVFDEAFNKMDEEHMDISVRLIKELGFQAIIAAPDDKLKVIGPVSDKIFFIENRSKQEISIYDFEKEQKDKLLE